MKIFYTKKFEREYKKLSREIKLKIELREVIFRKDPYSPTLKTHKLSGELEDFLSFSIDFKYRIVFEFIDDKDVFFHSVGDHDIYK
ncbi:MAG: type II toxin-antitoxin system mRNA interferase toxin, RelE/StbE family [Candidatus Taylorbacteria bacterium]